MTETKTRATPRTWDFLLTTFFIVLMIVLAVLALAIGLGLGFTATACADGADCLQGRVQWGIWIAAFGPPIVALIMTIVCVVRLVQRRIAFGLALLGLAMMGALLMLGIIVFDSGAPAAIA